MWTKVVVLILLLLIVYLHRNRYNDFNKRGWRDIIPLMDSGKWVQFVDKLQFKELCNDLDIATFDTLAVCDDVDEVIHLLPELPTEFVVKYTTDSGMNLIIEDKRQWSDEAIAKKLKSFKPRAIGNWIFGESQYAHVSPKYMIEKLVKPIPQDYKILVTDGKPILLWIDTDRMHVHKRAVFRIRDDFTIVFLHDCHWNYPIDKTIEPPPQNVVSQMCKTAMKLARKTNLPMVRVDLYWINSKIYGGELTLTSGAFTESITKECASYASGKQNSISARSTHIV